MKARKKLNLTEIKVESFVTNLSSQEKETIAGENQITIIEQISKFINKKMVCEVVNHSINDAKGCGFTTTIGIGPTNTPYVTQIKTECGCQNTVPIYSNHYGCQDQGQSVIYACPTA